jgi:hypothetical protein
MAAVEQPRMSALEAEGVVTPNLGSSRPQRQEQIAAKRNNRIVQNEKNVLMTLIFQSKKELPSDVRNFELIPSKMINVHLMALPLTIAVYGIFFIVFLLKAKDALKFSSCMTKIRQARRRFVSLTTSSRTTPGLITVTAKAHMITE